jgi:hypothetical protein
MNLSFHYNIDIDTKRKIAVAKIYGIWKKETALEYHEEYMDAIKPLTVGKWAKLTNLTNWKSSYPEIIEVLGEHLQWCHKNGAVYSVYAIDNPVTLRQLKKLIEESGINSAAKIFPSYSEADRFLRNNGF